LNPEGLTTNLLGIEEKDSFDLQFWSMSKWKRGRK